MRIPKNNAFGAGSPSWNLPFPNGNLTAAEILAYLPHWLKSVDVVDRFITNGARSLTIAAMINEFREQPTAEAWLPNSAQIMMSYAMRRAGYTDWTVGTHTDWPRENELKEDDLSVKGFRTPCLTHPKNTDSGNSQNLARNQEAEPINFIDLALHVKQHPAGADALDLARCVQYVIHHKDEKWLFPTDFERLVIHLGGPTPVTHSHHDKAVFARREKNLSTPRKLTRAPSNKATPRQNMAQARIGSALSKTLSGPRPAMPVSTPKKDKGGDLGRVLLGSKRRSGRLVGKAINLCEDSDVEGSDNFDSPRSGYTTPAKKRKLSHALHTLGSPANDSDFVQDQSEPDDEIPEAEDATDVEDLSLTPVPRGRAAARKARKVIRSSFVAYNPPLIPEKSKLVPIPKYMSTVVGPEVMQAAKDFVHRPPVWLAPPFLSTERLKVDENSIYLYAADGSTSMSEMWRSALSSSRFGGPRRHPPFRELHRLTDPDTRDVSDWAENIRWAKEQYRVFGSKTWTEYDYHLECITEHRRETLWVSEEVIRAGM